MSSRARLAVQTGCAWDVTRFIAVNVRRGSSMTVVGLITELIAMLAKYPKDTPVCAGDWDGWEDIQSVVIDKTDYGEPVILLRRRR